MGRPPGQGARIDLAQSLEQRILTCDDKWKLSELLREQAFTAPPSKHLDLHLRTFLQSPVPHLTAQVLQVYRYTGCEDPEIHEAAARFLKLNLYHDRWYDETIQSIGWANEHLADDLSSPLTEAYAEFIQEAELAEDDELLEFCRGYIR